MTKATITKTWIIGLIIFAVGMIAGGINLGLMLAFGGHFVPATNGNNFIPNNDATFWTPLGLMIGGFTVAAAGGIVQLAAWIGAVINTYQLPDKAWFAVLLVGGVLGVAFALFGFATMIAYLIAGPDGMAAQQSQGPAPSSQPATFPPVS
jgi:hypothetical protein